MEHQHWLGVIGPHIHWLGIVGMLAGVVWIKHLPDYKAMTPWQRLTSWPGMLMQASYFSLLVNCAIVIFKRLT